MVLNIESCYECPMYAIGGTAQNTRQSGAKPFRVYCTHNGVREVADPDQIPDWCPLPKAEEKEV